LSSAALLITSSFSAASFSTCGRMWTRGRATPALATGSATSPPAYSPASTCSVLAYSNLAAFAAFVCIDIPSYAIAAYSTATSLLPHP
jgi:hypothetical protein